MTTQTGRVSADTTVIEWAPFRLAEGVDEAAFVRASDEFQEKFVRHQRGFISRELIRGADGEWVDLVHWADQSSADAVMKAASESPECLEYFKLLAMDNPDPAAAVFHYRRLRVYGG